MLCFFFGDQKKNKNLRSIEWITYELLQEQKKIRQNQEKIASIFFFGSQEKKNTTFWDFIDCLTHKLFRKTKYDTFEEGYPEIIVDLTTMFRILVWFFTYLDKFQKKYDE